MPDQHDSPAVVEPPHVLPPCVSHVGVGNRERLRRDRAADRSKGEMPVHRREDPAALREPRGLVPGDRDRLRIGREIGVYALVVTDRRVDVEAVDPGALRVPGILAWLSPKGSKTVVCRLPRQGSGLPPALESHTVRAPAGAASPLRQTPAASAAATAASRPSLDT